MRMYVYIYIYIYIYIHMYMLILYIVYNIYNISIYYINIYACVCLHFTSFLCEAKVKSKEYNYNPYL